MEKKETFRFGVMGAGNISNKFCDAAEKTEEVCVTAVAARSEPESLQRNMKYIPIMEIMKKCFRKKSWMGSILVWLPECMCS